jgi:hypothetical protein
MTASDWWLIALNELSDDARVLRLPLVLCGSTAVIGNGHPTHDIIETNQLRGKIRSKVHFSDVDHADC